MLQLVVLLIALDHPASQPASAPTDDDATETVAQDKEEAVDADEPINDEAAELDKLHDLEVQQGQQAPPAIEVPSFPEDDLELAKRQTPLGRRAHPEEVAQLLIDDPSALFGRQLSIGEFSVWPLFVEYNGDGGLFDPKAYDIPMTMNPMVEQWIKFFTGRGREYFHRWLARSTRYIPPFRDILKEEGLPVDTVYLSMIESGFNAQAFSRAKASGPWQFMSGTGKRFGLRIDGWIDERRDFIKATHAAARYLKELHTQFGDWYLAWAGYNAGGGKMNKAVRKYDTKDFFEMTSDKRRYLRAETKNYVPKLIAAAVIAKSPKRFGFTDVAFLHPWEFDTIEVDGPVDLRFAAQAAGCDLDTMREMNSALKHGVTPPGQKYNLRIPRGSREQFLAKLAEVAPKTKTEYRVHSGRRGESVASIASRYGSTVELVREKNELGDATKLKYAQEIIVPLVPGIKAKIIKDDPEPVRVAKPKTATAVAASEPPPADGVHVVANGDNLWAISQKYGCSVQDLKEWNGINNHHALQIGQRLKVKE